MRKFLRASQVGPRSEKLPLVVLALLGQLTQIQGVRAVSLPLTDGWASRAAEVASGEHRHAGLYSDVADKTLTTKFADGWYTEETSPTGSFRWMSAVGHIDVTSRRGGTLVVRAHVRSFVPDNSLELLIDDKPVQSVKLAGVEWQDCLVRLALPAGAHHLAFRSHQPGSQPPGDNRVLTICVENLQTNLEP